MRQVLIVLVIAAFAYTGADAQTVCKPAPKHRTAVKHKTTEETVTACRMVPFLVCTIMPDRRSVSCYHTIDSDQQIRTGPTTIYGPTGPMPGETVHFKVRTVVVSQPEKGAYCKRNKEGNATICVQPGLILRDKDGYYSYGEPVPQKSAKRVTLK